MDWPATASRLAELVAGVVVPGHGDHAGRAFVERAGRGDPRPSRTWRGASSGASSTLDEAVAAAPFPAYPAEAPASRSNGRWPSSEASWPDRAGRYSATRTTQRPRASPATIASSAGSSVSSVTSVTCSPRSRGRRSVARRAQSARRRLDRHVGRVHPEQRHAAQDEREDGRLELRAAGVAGGGDRGAGPQRAQHVRQRRRRRPRRRPPPSVPIRAACPRRVTSSRVRIPAAPSVTQAVGLVGLAGRRPDLVAAVGEDRERRAADAAATRRSRARARRPGAARAPRGRRRTSPP